MGRLTYKRRKFIEEYLKCWNATEAARRAGYAYPNVEGPKNLVIPSIEVEIERRLTETAMDADETLARLAEQARGEGGQYLNSDGSLDFERLVTDGRTHLVKAIRPSKYGLIVEFYDAQSALVQIGKHLGLFTERALSIDVSKLTNEQLERIANGEDPIAVLATATTGESGIVEAKPPTGD